MARLERGYAGLIARLCRAHCAASHLHGLRKSRTIQSISLADSVAPQAGISYAIRLRATEKLRHAIARLATRPAGRPPGKPQVLHAGFGGPVQSSLNPRVRKPR